MQNEYQSSGPSPALSNLISKIDKHFYPIIGTPMAWIQIGRDRLKYETLEVHADTPEDACKFMWEKYFEPHTTEDEEGLFRPIFYRYTFRFVLEPVKDSKKWRLRTRVYLDGVHGKKHSEVML